jgi:hypothetical protein
MPARTNARGGEKTIETQGELKVKRVGSLKRKAALAHFNSVNPFNESTSS